MKSNKGFTLIELLVVILVIGILLGISIFGIQGAFINSRNTQRKSDLKQYQTALESFANRNPNGLYPGYAAAVNAATTLCSQLSSTSCPEDPIATEDNGYNYRYISDGSLNNGTAAASVYVLWSTLETSTATYWVLCSDGRSGERGTVPTATCPF